MRFNDLFSAVSCYDLIFSGCIISLIYFSGSHSYVGFFFLYRDMGRSERIIEQEKNIRRG